jgi:hypothetical protein
MKTFYPSGMAIACLLIALNSCVSTQNTVEPQKTVIDTPKEEISCFVQMNDGSIKNYATIKLITGVFKKPHLLADGNVIINAADIKAYQDLQHYAVAQKEFTTAKPSHVAVEALPGFAVRVAKGKINVYSLKYYNGHNASEKFFLQSGEEGKIVAYSPELMNELLKDNTDAYTFFNENSKVTVFSKKLLISVEIYNTSRFISKN